MSLSFEFCGEASKKKLLSCALAGPSVAAAEALLRTHFRDARAAAAHKYVSEHGPAAAPPLPSI